MHRQLASGLSMPVGMKNRPDTAIGTAADAIVAAGVPHVFPGIAMSGLPDVLRTPPTPIATWCCAVGGTRPPTTPPRSPKRCACWRLPVRPSGW
jgi:3-deoxy-7-phosphoheptulonate synthase